MRIYVNAAQCANCGDVIVSRTVHDFQQCACGSIFVDGGSEYRRRGGSPELFVDLCLRSREEREAIQ